MKFKEFLSEDSYDDRKINHWLENNIYWILPKGGGAQKVDKISRELLNDHFEVCDGKIRANDIDMICFKGIKLSEIPFNSGAWITAGDGRGNPFKVVRFNECIVDDWKNAPLCQNLVFDSCDVKTFQLSGHVKNSTIYRPTMSFIGHETKFDCGVLSLLKQERFKEILTLNVSENIQKAIEIIKKHLGKDADLAEVVEELDDANLGEYAKL